MTYRSSLAVGLATALSIPLAAQQSLASPDGDWSVPIHATPRSLDGAVGPEAALLWASRDSYKASFGSAITFYPVLGESYPTNQPLTWATTLVQAGGTVLVDGSSTGAARSSDWRYTLDYGRVGVREVYDVLPEGLEQSFVLERAPSSPGDLVVRGRLTTPLSCNAFLEPAHRELRFVDASGREILRYGKAFAIDADGDVQEITTTFDGDTVELRVGAGWVANATFPVTIDPLVDRTTLIMGGGNRIPSPNIARDDFANQVLITRTRAVSGIDFDAFSRLRFDNWNFRGIPFSDVTSVNTPSVGVGFVEGSSKWVLATQRLDLFGSVIQMYVHDSDDPTTNSGTTINVPGVPFAYDQFPSVGGRDGLALGGNALVAFQRDMNAVSSSTSRVHSIAFDPLNSTFGTTQTHSSGSANYDAERPCVSAHAANTGSWVVVWQEYNNSIGGDDWDVWGERVNSLGFQQGAAVFGPATDPATHALRPMVAGQGGRYMTAYVERENTSGDSDPDGPRVCVQRFDWAETASAPASQPAMTAFEDILGINRVRTGEAVRSLSYDTNTDSHWVLAFRVGGFLRAVRLGFEGGVVESVIVQNPTGAGAAGDDGSVIFDDDNDLHKIVFGNDTGEFVGANFEFQPSTNTRYGLGGCGIALDPENRGNTNLPHAGSEFFGLRYHGGLPSRVVFLLAGFTPTNQVLPSGCLLLLDPNMPTFLVHAAPADATGELFCPLPFSAPFAGADVYWQGLQIDALGDVVGSNGLLTQIR